MRYFTEKDVLGKSFKKTVESVFEVHSQMRWGVVKRSNTAYLSFDNSIGTPKKIPLIFDSETRLFIVSETSLFTALRSLEKTPRYGLDTFLDELSTIPKLGRCSLGYHEKAPQRRCDEGNLTSNEIVFRYYEHKLFVKIRNSKHHYANTFTLDPHETLSDMDEDLVLAIGDSFVSEDGMLNINASQYLCPSCVLMMFVDLSYQRGGVMHPLYLRSDP